MKRKQKEPEHISRIEVYENQGYRIDVDCVYIGQFLNLSTNSSKFDGLVPALGLCSIRDQKKAVELVSQINVRFPLLVCGDDLDFSLLW